MPTPTYAEVIHRGVAAFDAMMRGAGDCWAVTNAVVLAARLRGRAGSSNGKIDLSAVNDAYADVLQIYGRRLAAQFGGTLDALSPSAALEVEQAIADAMAQAGESFRISLTQLYR